MKKLLVIIFCLTGISISAQVNLTLENTVYVSTDPNWDGIDIPRAVPTNLIFRNNSISSVNPGNYMLQCGDDLPAGKNNNLDGTIISGNKFYWHGVTGAEITHGVMAGYSLNYSIRHNYFDNVPYNLVFEGIAGMKYTYGGVSYNVFVKGRLNEICINGQNNVPVYNNTFYTDKPNYSAAFIKVDVLTQVTPTATSNNIKIKNNIFYSVNNVNMISVGDSSIKTLECDYNIYWNENNIDHEPTFYSLDGLKTWSWDEWRALGFDAHSIIANPNFIDRINFVPSARLDFGTNLGAAFYEGLAIDAVWGSGDPDKEVQGTIWQVGAHVYNSTSVGSVGYENNDLLYLFPNPNDGNFTLNLNDSWKDGSYSITIINSTGIVVYKGTILNSENLNNFNLSYLDSGIYIINVTHNNRTRSKKFIKR